jgi:hypothetical protein
LVVLLLRGCCDASASQARTIIAGYQSRIYANQSFQELLHNVVRQAQIVGVAREPSFKTFSDATTTTIVA